MGAESDFRRVLSVSKHNFLLISVKRIVGFQICIIIHAYMKSLINLKKFWWVIACAPRDDWYITGLPLYFRGHVINSAFNLNCSVDIVKNLKQSELCSEFGRWWEQNLENILYAYCFFMNTQIMISFIPLCHQQPV